MIDSHYLNVSKQTTTMTRLRQPTPYIIQKKHQLAKLFRHILTLILVKGNALILPPANPSGFGANIPPAKPGVAFEIR